MVKEVSIIDCVSCNILNIIRLFKHIGLDVHLVNSKLILRHQIVNISWCSIILKCYFIY